MLSIRKIAAIQSWKQIKLFCPFTFTVTKWSTPTSHQSHISIFYYVWLTDANHYLHQPIHQQAGALMLGYLMTQLYIPVYSNRSWKQDASFVTWPIVMILHYSEFHNNYKSTHRHTLTCGPSHERWWRRQVVLNPHWCCSCGVADTSPTGETDPGSHRAGSSQHRCLSWGGTQVHYVYTCNVSIIRGA